jgi:putative FmdB family regulatory protein
MVTTSAVWGVSGGTRGLSLDLPAGMPIYEYRCENGHTFEVMQRMTDDPVAVCPEDGAPVQRVFHPVAVHFKGKGFYNTDYGTRKRSRELKESAEKGADKTEAKATEKKKEKESKASGGGEKKSGSSDS